MVCARGASIDTIQTPLILDEDVIESVRIARGKAAGAVALDGIAPVVQMPGFLRLVADLGGRLDTAMGKRLVEYGIDSDMYKAVSADASKLHEIRVDDSLYAVEHDKHGYSVRLAGTYESTPAMPEIAQIEAPAAPVIEVAAPVESKPEPRFLTKFLLERTIKQEDGRVKASELYASYTAWCALHGVEPISKPAFGYELFATGYKPKKSGPTRYWSGLVLIGDLPLAA